MTLTRFNKMHSRAFSIIELMIVIAIVAILLGLSYPSYVGFVRKSNRAEAVVELLDWANRQDIWRADNPSYSTAINPNNSTNYTYSIVANAVSYTLTATAQGDQAADKEDGLSCAVLTLNQSGIAGPSGKETCWNH